VFATTHWSVVLAAGQSASPNAQQALEKLCRNYWYPLYAFVRRQGNSPEDAQDLTQEFFARLLDREFVALADPARGRFRSFLLGCLKHFLSEQHRRAARLKRGGGHTVLSWDTQSAEERYGSEPADRLTPEKIYERRWALALLETALARMSEEIARGVQARLLPELRSFLWGERNSASYAEIAAQVGLTEASLKVTVHRLRRRYRELLREEVADTVGSGEEIDEELRHLMAAIRG
jgi:RNA polymerase sigma-70 factor (ECF subfamily)